MTHELCVLDRRGDTRTTWAPDDPVTLKAAQEIFQNLKVGGYSMFKLEGPDNQGVQLHSFDQTAERIIAVARIAGG